MVKLKEILERIKKRKKLELEEFKALGEVLIPKKGSKPLLSRIEKKSKKRSE